MAENRFVAGQFIWTGFDYRGEPNPYSWPSVTSQTGAVDLAGLPKPVYYYWRAWWGKEPSVYILPRWNLPQTSIGKRVLVRCFANCERVELSLNGKSLGVQRMPQNLYLDWHVPYTPGTLTATGFNQGRVAARYSVKTAGAPAALRLMPEFQHLVADEEEILPIQVAIVDAEGQVVPDADKQIEFLVSGAGTLAGVANGNPASHESNVAHQRQTFRGLALVLVKDGEQPGTITVEARANGLASARITVPTTRMTRTKR